MSNPDPQPDEADQPPDSLDDILEQYAALTDPDDGDSEAAERLRLAFLDKIHEQPDLLEKRTYSHFLAEHVDPLELAELEWDSPRQMISISESLYQSRLESDKRARHLHEHARMLLRRALHQYEREGEVEKMFELLRLAPSFLLTRDDELSRLHYRANVYELRRVRRNRRILTGLLVVQALLVLFVFPHLFINAENGRIQRQVEELTDVEIGDEGYRLISYSEGVYWAVITAASIGYGDVTPRTTTGRIIAGVLGVMGVVTVGILAGLVLDWISPRRIT